MIVKDRTIRTGDLSDLGIQSIPEVKPDLSVEKRRIGEALDRIEFNMAGLERLQREEGVPYPGGSVFRDIAAAAKADSEAERRLDSYFAEGAKAADLNQSYAETTDARGGFLLQPRLQPVEPRPPRPELLSVFPTLEFSDTNEAEFPKWVDPALAVDWRADVAEAPQVNQAVLSSIVGGVHTLTGYSAASNQLMEDSNVDDLVRDLIEWQAGQVIERALLNGTGTGQPRGITQTSGVISQLYDDASPTVAELLAQITNAIVAIAEQHGGMPTHIVMRPQTLFRIILDASAQGLFTVNPLTLLTLPVVLTTNITGTYAAGVNGASTGGTQARVIVLDARAQLVMRRAAMAFDVSKHPHFLQNASLFRGTARLGATFERRPVSIAIVHGTGLVNTFA